jgi:hypothetical protein
MSISASEVNAEATSLYASWLGNLKLLGQQGLHPSARLMYEEDLLDVYASADLLLKHNQDLLTPINLSKLQILLKRSAAETQVLLKAATGHYSLM